MAENEGQETMNIVMTWSWIGTFSSKIEFGIYNSQKKIPLFYLHR